MSQSFLLATVFLSFLAIQESTERQMSSVSKQSITRNHEDTSPALLNYKAHRFSISHLPISRNSKFFRKRSPPHQKKRFQVPSQVSQIVGTGTQYSGNPANFGIADHGDSFMCKPCMCSHTHHGMIIANCSHLKLHSIPGSLPKTTWSLYLEGNAIRIFNTSLLRLYPSLNSLNLSASCIREIIGPKKGMNGSKYDFVSKLETLDLRHNKLKTIEDGSLSIMPNLLFLQLENNMITKISNYTFEHSTSIKQLILSNNKLRHIELSAFDGFVHLQDLRLDKNRHLTLPGKPLNPRLFRALKNLLILDIRKTTHMKNTEYSTEALSELVSLKELSCDGLKSRFGEKMSKLKHLEILSLGPNEICYLKDINETFFQYVPHLTSLQITECKIDYFNYTSFKFIPSIQSLTLRYLYDFNLSMGFDVLKGLTNSTLKTLRLIRMYHRAPPCVFLKARHAKYLQYITGLEELDLSSNRISLLGHDFSKLIPKSLQRLILVDNKLTLIGFILTQITSLNNLSMLDVSEQNREKKFLYKDYSFWDHNEKYLLKYEDQTETSGYSFPAHGYEGEEKDMSSSITNKEEYVRGHLKIPENLLVLRASGYSFFGQVVLSRRLASNKLRSLSFVNSYLTHWGVGILPSGIQSLDLEENYCHEIRNNFFPSNNSVIQLNIKRNYLGDSFARDSEGTIFSKLKKTLIVDISFNGIYFLPQQFFRGLTNLNALMMSDNKIQILNVSLSHMKSLEYLDVSRNSITWISKETRNDLDIVALKTGLRIDLVKNPLPCSCEGIEVLRWMATSKVHLLNKDYLQCRLPSGHIDYIGNLDTRVKFLQRQCISRGIIIIATFASVVLVLTAFTALLLYRYRWRLRYMKNITLSKWFGSNPPQPGENTRFKFDAYVVNTEEDRDFARECVEQLEKKRNHRLFIGDRDSLPGSFEINNITCAVHNSNTTLLILTPNLLAERGLHEYATQMALYEGSYEHRDSLYILEPYPVSQDVMTQELRLVKSKQRFTEWPQESEITTALNDQLWDEVSAAIGHVKIEQQQPSTSGGYD